MKSILELANEVVAARRETYGLPDDHWQRTANMVNAAFTERVRRRLDAGEPMFAIEDWPIIMSLDKISRELGEATHRDNPIDIVGYMHGRDEILAKRAEATRLSTFTALRSCPSSEPHEGPHEWVDDSDGRTRHCFGRDRCAAEFTTDAGADIRCQLGAGHEGEMMMTHQHEHEAGLYVWGAGLQLEFGGASAEA